MTDAAALGTDASTGYTVVNDQITLPAFGPANSSAYQDISTAPAQTGTATPARTGFAPNFGLSYGTTFVPMGEHITAMTGGITADPNHRLETTADEEAGTGAANAPTAGSLTTGGLINYNAMRNQMQGPSKLGGRVSRIRHRSSAGVDSFLNFEQDIAILDKTEEAPNLSLIHI